MPEHLLYHLRVLAVDEAERRRRDGGLRWHPGLDLSPGGPPRVRRRGIATALVRKVEDGLADLGCPKINLQVRAENAEVVEFYRAAGYEAEERVSMGKTLWDEQSETWEKD